MGAYTGEVRVYVNRVLVATSMEIRQDYVLAADFPEAPTKNEITLVLINPSSNREIDRVVCLLPLSLLLLYFFNAGCAIPLCCTHASESYLCIRAAADILESCDDNQDVWFR